MAADERLPLSRLASFRHNAMLNLAYPGLELVWQSERSGAPIFTVADFLSEDECSRILSKCAGAWVDSAPGKEAPAGTVRTSRNVVLAKSETPSIQSRIALLANRPTASLAPLKVVRYECGEAFSMHLDTAGLSAAQLALNWVGLPGAGGEQRVPENVNVEMTVFVYLSDVAQGGETAFYDSFPDGAETIRIQPRRGMAVVFYVTPQREIERCAWCHGPESSFAFRDMLHAGLPVLDPKYLVAQWIWSVDMDRDPRELSADNTPRVLGGELV